MEKISWMVLERFLWQRLDAKVVIVYATVLYKNILICWAYVRVRCANVIQKESLLMTQRSVKRVNRRNKMLQYAYQRKRRIRYVLSNKRKRQRTRVDVWEWNQKEQQWINYFWCWPYYLPWAPARWVKNVPIHKMERRFHRGCGSMATNQSI